VANKSGRSKGYVELLGQALIDKDLREKVLNSPEDISADFNLTAFELESLRSIDRKKFEAAARKLGKETTAEMKIVIAGHFAKNP
jgi:hypothetical protein